MRQVVIEPAAGTGLAALLDGQIAAAEAEAKAREGGPSSSAADPPRVGIVLCGGNVDLSKGLPWVQ